MKLTVVIVNHNVKYYLEQCLSSLYRAIDNLSAEVIVVDNASGDGSEAYIAHRFARVSYIYNNENLGFSCANNQAIRQAAGEYILLLNPDTVLPECTLEEAIAFMDAHPRAGAVGVKMLRGDGHFLPESKRGYPTLAATFGKLTGLGRLFPRSPGLGGYYCNALDEDSIHRVEVLAGAFMLIRHAALKKTGLLDEDFFMYGEDIDLSCRIEAAGYENYYVPLPILHYKGESTSKDSYRHVRVFCEAMDIFFCKHGGRCGVIGRALVRTGIRLQMYVRLLMLFVRRAFSPSGAKADSAAQREQPFARFLVFGAEATIHSLRPLLKRNGLTGRHHFVVADEASATDGHGGSFISLKGFTHVVYDCRAFSYSNIIRLLYRHRKMGLSLGIYNPESRVLVTPEKCYI